MIRDIIKEIHKCIAGNIKCNRKPQFNPNAYVVQINGDIDGIIKSRARKRNLMTIRTSLGKI